MSPCSSSESRIAKVSAVVRDTGQRRCLCVFDILRRLRAESVAAESSINGRLHMKTGYEQRNIRKIRLKVLGRRKDGLSNKRRS